MRAVYKIHFSAPERVYFSAPERARVPPAAVRSSSWSSARLCEPACRAGHRGGSRCGCRAWAAR